MLLTSGCVGVLEPVTDSYLACTGDSRELLHREVVQVVVARETRGMDGILNRLPDRRCVSLGLIALSQRPSPLICTHCPCE